MMGRQTVDQSQLFYRVHAVNLKNRFRDIETDRANLAHGRHPSSGSFRRNHPMAP
jgi:hypothetical protein